MPFKKNSVLLLLLLTGLVSMAQTPVQKNEYFFTAPLATSAKEMCDCIAAKEKPVGKNLEDFDWAFETRLFRLAGVKPEEAKNDTSIERVKLYWDKYKTYFKCRSTSFNIEGGSLLKFAITQNFTPFIENIVSNWDLDISFVDPVDNRNVLDYVNDELQVAVSTQGMSHPRVKVLKEYKELLEDLGCKPSKPANK